MTRSSEWGNRYAGVRVAVLGASGFIGRWVARALCEKGAQVHLVVRDRIAAQSVFSRYGIHGTVYEADLTVPRAIPALLHRIGPSVVFNLIGYGIDRSETDGQMAYEVNAHLVGAIGAAVLGVRDPEWPGQDIVHAGSGQEYGTAGGNLSEDSIASPTTLYGRSKLAGTLLLSDLCRLHHLKGLTARLFTVYGPGEHRGRLLPSLMEAAGTGEPLPLTEGKQQRDFTYVEDVAEGLLRLGIASATPGEIVNLATGRLTSVRDFAEIAAGVLQIPRGRLMFGTIPTRAEEMDHDPVATARLRQLAGWIPRIAIEDGIRRSWRLD